jgi:hypothetical protein
MKSKGQTCSFCGRKLKKALYLQSKEQTGKGIFMNEILKSIFGDRMLKTNSTEAILKFTKVLFVFKIVNTALIVAGL